MDISVDPVVFYCSGCHKILGDTLSFIDTNDILKSIVLSSVTNSVDISTTLITSNDTLDTGSTFVWLNCSNCQRLIGKKYHSTPDHLAYLRDNFSLNMFNGNVAWYQLGSQKPQSSIRQSFTEQDSDGADLSDLFKIKSVLLHYQQRLDNNDKGQLSLRQKLNEHDKRLDSFDKDQLDLQQDLDDRVQSIDSLQHKLKLLQRRLDHLESKIPK